MFFYLYFSFFFFCSSSIFITYYFFTFIFLFWFFFYCSSIFITYLFSTFLFNKHSSQYLYFSLYFLSVNVHNLKNISLKNKSLKALFWTVLSVRKYLKLLKLLFSNRISKKKIFFLLKYVLRRASQTAGWLEWTNCSSTTFLYFLQVVPYHSWLTRMNHLFEYHFLFFFLLQVVPFLFQEAVGFVHLTAGW